MGDQLREIIEYSGRRTMDALEWKELDEFLFARRWSTTPRAAVRVAYEYLASAQPVRPG